MVFDFYFDGVTVKTGNWFQSKMASLLLPITPRAPLGRASERRVETSQSKDSLLLSGECFGERIVKGTQSRRVCCLFW